MRNKKKQRDFAAQRALSTNGMFECVGISEVEWSDKRKEDDVAKP